MIRNLSKHADAFFRNAPLHETGFSQVEGARDVISADSRDRFSGALPPANSEYEHLPPPPANFDESMLPPPPAEEAKKGFGARWGR